jgi:hypothetical protein
MAIFDVIDITDGGDTFYEGMVKVLANFTILESEITDARDSQASVHAAIDLKVKAPAANTADYVPQWNGANSKTLKDGFIITAAGKALLDDANAAAQLTTLGITAAGQALLDDASADAQLTTLGVTAAAKTILDDANVAAILVSLGLEAIAEEINLLHDATSTPAANKAAIRDANSIVKGSELSMTGETSAASVTASTSLASLNVKNGDRLFVSATCSITTTTAGAFLLRIYKSDGTATVAFDHDLSGISEDIELNDGTNVLRISGIAKITGDGTLTLTSNANAPGTVTYQNNQIYAFFLKKT